MAIRQQTPRYFKKTMNHFTQKIFVASLLAACSATSFAQYAGGGTGGMGGSRRSRVGDASTIANTESATASPIARINQMVDKLYDLRMRLLISPEQASTWDDFQDKARSWAEEAYRGRRATATYEPSALQSMQFRLNDAQNRYARMESLNDAVKKLYVILTQDQQRIADQYLPPIIP